MRIIHVAAEIAPIAKAGGMGDVLQGLCRQLIQEGHDVRAFLPKYSFLPDALFQSQKKEDFSSFEKGLWHSNSAWATHIDEIPLTLIEDHHPAFYFSQRKTIYGYEDDLPRFLYFCRAVLDFLLKKGEEIDILHLHDWHTSLIAPLYREVFCHQGLKIKSIVLTLHNTEHQGKCASWDLDNIGLKGKELLDPSKMQGEDPQYPDTLNLLKGGIVYSDAITAVSPTYACEILKAENAFGLGKVLQTHQNKIHGILNGIDIKTWNPEKDLALPTTYHAKEALKNIQKAKGSCKKELCKRLGLQEKNSPLLATISRLVPQKGPKLIRHAIEHTLEKGGQFVLLGSTPIPSIQEEFLAFQEKLKEKRRDFALILEYNEELAHLLYASSDFLVIPSLFEPCGLTQLIALRYGSFPIARKTGGLADTIFDIDDPCSEETKKNGFVFKNFDEKGLESALDRALDYWFCRSSLLLEKIPNAMTQDFSWKEPAKKYLKLYEKILKF